MKPIVSIVMSVYNGERELRNTIESVLSQTIRDFEFIIINDGSTDHTAEILAEYADKDQRIHVITTLNKGLTSALITGCQAATAPVIARQDVGDRSLSDRLEKQLEVLKADTSIVAVGGGYSLVGPKGENLGSHSRELSPTEVTTELQELEIGLCHALSVFRRDAYEEVGGYRIQFRYAQDTDLWYRLSEIGLLAEHPECLSEIKIDLTGISGQNTGRQVRLAELARNCFQARKKHLSESVFLQQAEEVSLQKHRASHLKIQSPNIARPSYFIGSTLFDRRNSSCRIYFIKAMKSFSLFAPALLKYCASYFVCNHRNTS